MQTDFKKIAERIKYLREVFNLSADEFQSALNLPAEQFRELEEGKVDFTFSFLNKVSKYFSVDIAELISGDEPRLSGFEVVRKGEGMPLTRRKGFDYLHLAPLFKDKSAEPFTVHAGYKPEETPIALSTHDDQEFNLVLKGKLRFKIGSFETVLSEGDTVYYDARLPHGMAAYEGDCDFLSVVVKNSAEASEPKLIGESAAEKDSDALYKKYVTPILGPDGRLASLKFHPPENFNFAYDVVDRIAEKSPSKPAMLWLSREKEERIFTFAEIKEGSDKCANFFLSLGIKKGDKVMLVLKRQYEFWFSVLALHKIGAIAVPATHLLAKKDFEYRFNAAGIFAVVMTDDPHTIGECEAALPASPTMKIKIVTGPARPGWLSYSEGFEAASSDLKRIENGIDETMLMYFTSGTTGYPKIASHSYGYPLGHFVTAKYWHNVDPDGLHLTISDTGWAKSMWGKLYGQWLCEGAIFAYDFDRFNAAELLSMFGKYGITTFCAPPTMYRYFIKEDLSKYDLSSLKYATIAGEALNPEVFEQFYKATGVKLMEGYGQTENTLLVGNLVGTNPKPGSMGKPNPQYDVDLVDSEGKSVKTGEVGEIVVRTGEKPPFGMFKGYYRDEKATLAAWHDGVYHTGDVAWRDEDGFIWFVGRTDDVIKSSGYKIGPFEVESVIMEIPYILECAVTGVPDATRGQAVKASIVLVKGKAPSEALKKEIQEYVKTHTAPYKYPRVIEFLDSLPKTISGKIMRKDLR
jgi:Acyl-coenzyme A synthetases/AMP-(fatty) acid ligases